MTEVRAAIAGECDDLKALLLEKNERYGNSATNPVRVFSTASPEEQLRVRIDDKLSRIFRRVPGVDADGFARVLRVALEAGGEDTVLDLAGYLVLLRAERRLRSQAVGGLR